MNIIAANYAVSIFPRSTFIHRYSFIARKRPGRTLDWVTKYTDRGFRVVGEDGVLPRRELVLGERYVMDRHCWTIAFRGNSFIYRAFLTLKSVSKNKFPNTDPFDDPGIYGYTRHRVEFDVIGLASGLVRPGEHVRIEERFTRR